MIVHLIGNGPSKKDFVNEPFGPIFGCNLADPNMPLKATFIMDKVCIDFIHNNKIKMNFPVIVPQALKKLILKCDPPVEVYDTVPDGVYNGESTGHKAVEYLLKSGYTEIHMWGFDSLYRDTIESDSHQKMPDAPTCKNNYIPWRKKWTRIFRSPLGSKCNFVIHGKPTTSS